MRGLESIDNAPDMYGCFLAPAIMRKLPEWNTMWVEMIRMIRSLRCTRT